MPVRFTPTLQILDVARCFFARKSGKLRAITSFGNSKYDVILSSKVQTFEAERDVFLVIRGKGVLFLCDSNVSGETNMDDICISLKLNMVADIFVIFFFSCRR